MVRWGLLALPRVNRTGEISSRLDRSTPKVCLNADLRGEIIAFITSRMTEMEVARHGASAHEMPRGVLVGIAAPAAPCG